MAATGLALLPGRCLFHRCGTLRAKKSKKKVLYTVLDCLRSQKQCFPSLPFHILDRGGHQFLLFASSMEKLSAECRLYDWLTNLNSSYLLSQSEAKEESTVISTIAFSRPQPRLRVLVSLRSDWVSELSTSVMIG